MPGDKTTAPVGDVQVPPVRSEAERRIRREFDRHMKTDWSESFGAVLRDLIRAEGMADGFERGILESELVVLWLVGVWICISRYCAAHPEFERIVLEAAETFNQADGNNPQARYDATMAVLTAGL